MPYASQAQAGYFHTHRSELAAQGVDVDEWDAATKGKKLPKQVKKSFVKLQYKEYEMTNRDANFMMWLGKQAAVMSLLRGGGGSPASSQTMQKQIGNVGQTIGTAVGGVADFASRPLMGAAGGAMQGYRQGGLWGGFKGALGGAARGVGQQAMIAGDIATRPVQGLIGAGRRGISGAMGGGGGGFSQGWREGMQGNPLAANQPAQPLVRF